MNKIIITLIAVIFALGIYFAFFDNSGQQNNIAKIDENVQGKIKVVNGEEFDFGEILMEGGDVKRNFVLQNVGTGPIKINKVSTSCMCTEAQVFDLEGNSLGKFGMGGAHGPNPQINLEIPAGEQVQVEVKYDPLAHGPDAVGKLVREVYIETNKGERTTLKVKGIGVKSFSKEEKKSLKFTNKEFDFGETKQSGGIYETEFTLVNNGAETVKIDSLPTSCQCVTAEIDKSEIKAGETAKVKVKFDANLHPEPAGRFYKIIDLMEGEESLAQLKIYAKMNYDLGMDKLKLAKHDDGDDHKKTKSDKKTDIQTNEIKNISAADLAKMLKQKDFTLIDVHIPEQEHIPGTDMMIAYNEVDKIMKQVPDKNAKIILYCRSGGMSIMTANELKKQGYTNIYNLEQGLNEWQAENRKTLPKGSVPKF